LAQEVFLNPDSLKKWGRVAMEKALGDLVAPLTKEQDLMGELREFKERQFLRIGRLDLTGKLGPVDVMEEISDLAAACVQTALEWHSKRLRAKYGAPAGIGDGYGLVVLGMGKLAGRELNFSSDVDLIFICAHHEGRTQGPNPVSTRRFFEELAQSVRKSLSEVTERGFVFRVDLRLRPEGEKGELVPSAQNAIGYYLSWGRTWERAALMKAAPIAGDFHLGSGFLKAVEPFIYRRHLDYSTLEDMREMKRTIQSQLKRKPNINVKLGQGGIREIEFFVQALQLINGGKNPQVREPGAIRALELLMNHELLEPGTAEDLKEAYLFFRDVEHKIQINYQLQTHEIPVAADQQAELAERMGYGPEGLERFMEELDSKRRMVEDLFVSLFHYADEAGLDEISSESGKICESINDREKTLMLLEDAGFADPESAYEPLKGLASPSKRRGLTDRGKAMLEKLAPLLVDELLKCPEPDEALRSLDRYIDSLKGGSAYLATFLENPPTARYLTQILGQSKFFGDMLVKYPQAVDSLIARRHNEPPKEKGPLMEDLRLRLAAADSYETELDVLREFKHEETLRIGAWRLSEEILATTARWLITELAEACLEVAVDIAAREMGRKFGAFDFFDKLPFVIVGMGKVGGQEMSYVSDLDVIFIFDPPMENIGPLSSKEWFTRLANRVISILSVPTSQGVAYEIDTRLRPSGNQGPLVSTLESFRDYHHGGESKMWEKQALIKARPVTGPESLRKEVTSIISECVSATNLDKEGLEEMVRLRRRMEAELADEDMMHVDLKTGHGGLVDVEFLVQANILTHVKQHPHILRHNTLEALETQYSEGIIDSEAFHTLSGGYRFLSDMVDMLRLREQRSVNRLTLSGPILRGVSKRMGFAAKGEDAFISEYFRITRAIRNIYNRVFNLIH
jgi:glutamate-ammonia-ligase adenylyltransferase